ncbi:MAG: hypothetical protein JNJ54_36015 [Myxococcaceae bacterium]|nr:hypothetical protein [Myxococcaceae bacterium]
MGWAIDVGAGCVAGALGGLLCGALELRWRQHANRARIARGEPGRRDELFPRWWLPGAMVGAAVAVAAASGGLLMVTTGALVAPSALWLVARLVGASIARLGRPRV